MLSFGRHDHANCFDDADNHDAAALFIIMMMEEAGRKWGKGQREEKRSYREEESLVSSGVESRLTGQVEAWSDRAIKSGLCLIQRWLVSCWFISQDFMTRQMRSGH